MRLRLPLAAVALLLAAPAASGQDAFDACQAFTAQDAGKVLGAPVQTEPVNPRVKRPRFVPACTYAATVEGKKLAATAQFRFGRVAGDLRPAFDEARLQLQTKPLIIGGADAFWSAKTGQLHLHKGRAWLTVSVGTGKESERDLEAARHLAEILAGRF